MKLWIARDEFGTLSFHKTKPLYDWVLHRWSNLICYFKKDVFKEVTFENSPQEVELKLVSEIVGVAESPLKTFPRVNEFEVGASYRR